MGDIGTMLEYATFVLFISGVALSKYTMSNFGWFNYHSRRFSEEEAGPNETLDELRNLRRSRFATKSTKKALDRACSLIERYKEAPPEEQKEILSAFRIE